MLTLRHKVNPDAISVSGSSTDQNFTAYEGGGFEAYVIPESKDSWRIELSVPELSALDIYYRKRRPRPSDIKRVATSWARSHGYKENKR